MKINLSQSITAVQTRAERARQDIKLADKGTIGRLLEGMADDNRPVIIEIYGVKEDRLPGDYFLRECRGIFVFESATFKEREKIRLEEEARAAVQAKRTFRLNQIKAKIRSELKTESVEREKDGEDFDRKYDEQKESAIEKEALTILEAEEKQSNK